MFGVNSHVSFADKFGSDDNADEEQVNRTAVAAFFLEGVFSRMILQYE